MDIEESQGFVVRTRKRFKIFCILYWRSLVIITSPIILLPVTFTGGEAYKSFYLFLIMTVYWTTNALPPCVTALMPAAFNIILWKLDVFTNVEVYTSNVVVNCMGAMMLTIAIEFSNVHVRVALKLLIVFGCSHYRLSFLIFFGTMLISMWVSNTVACGVMMPIVKAVLLELEKLGILEMYEQDDNTKEKSLTHDESFPSPTDVTIFYYLGIAYSAAIGGCATIIGSPSIQFFAIYCQKHFPDGPLIEFPHFMLLNLPGMLILETLTYYWMNFYFFGLYRSINPIVLQANMTLEEVEYTKTVLRTQYGQLGRITFHEITVCCIVSLALLLEMIVNFNYHEPSGYEQYGSRIYLKTPPILCVFVLFLVPRDLEFIKYFKNNSEEDLPVHSSKACLNWQEVSKNIPWNALIIIGGCCAIMEAMRDSGMMEEIEKFLLLQQKWPTFATELIIIIMCKILTEFVPNVTIVFGIVPVLGRVSTVFEAHPYNIMLSGVLASSYPFHIVTASPANVMVASYVHIPHSRMLLAGVGPSILAIMVTWFTICIWSNAIWTDANIYPKWALNHNPF